MSLPARIARLNTDGTTDTSFAPVAGLNAAGLAVAVLSDGRIIAGGKFTAAAGANRDYLAVLEADGGIDPTVLDANGWVRALAVQTDGKVIVVGSFTELDALSRLRIARLSPVLMVEPAYDPRANASLHAIAGQEDGKTIIGGAITSVAGVARNGIARLLNDAAPQSLAVLSATTVRWLRGGASAETMRVSFEVDTGGGYGALGGTVARIAGGWQVTGLALTGTGTIRARAWPSDSHAGGVIEETAAFNVAPEIGAQIDGSELTDAGSHDAGDVRLGQSRDYTLTIGNTGLASLTLTGPTPVGFTGTHAAQWSVVAQPALSVAAGASVSCVLRFTPTSEGNKTAVLNIVSDDADEATFNVTLNADCMPGSGSVDASFQPTSSGGIFHGVIAATGTRVYAGGGFTTINGVNRGRWAMLGLAGSVVAQSGAGANNDVRAAVMLLSGQWLIGGLFTAFHGVARTRLARVNADGSLDASFNIAVNGTVNDLALEADGNVIVAGDFTTVGGQARQGMARILTAGSGTVDAAFQPNPGHCIRVMVQTDGKILFSQYNATRFVWRLNADGSTDTTFVAAAATVSAVDLAVQADGKVLASNGGGVQRLTTAGAADGSWTTDARTLTRSLVLQADGKVIAAGGGTAVRKYLTTGAQDTSFADHAASLYERVRLQADGKVLLIGRQLLSITSAPCVLKRLLNDEASGALSVVSNTELQWLRGGTAPEADWVRFELSEDGGTVWTLLKVGARISGGWAATGISLPKAGMIRARACCGAALHDATLSFTGLPVPDLDVTRLVTGAPAVSVADNGSVAFAGVLPTQTSDVTLKLRNSGLATLSGLTLTMTGAEFSVISLDLTSLEPGQVATAIIRCTPSATGERSGVLDITSNVPGTKAVYRVLLTGYGITNPAAITDAATLITSTAARLPVRVTANADVATAYVRYRRAGTADAWTLSPVPAWDIAGFTSASLYRDVGSLTPATSYEFQAIAINAVSTKEGNLRTFTTLA